MKNNCLIILTMVFALWGCEQKQNLATLCENHPDICNEFESDSWCRSERIKVGFNNLAVQRENKDIDKYYLLLSYEDYAACMSHASKIEHIKYKNKKTIRTNNFVKAKQQIEYWSDNTKSSEHPELLYYHWTRYLNDKALQKFLALEGSKALESTESQFNLATYYTKRDPNKTIKILYRALELYQPSKPLNIEILKSLTTIFEDKKEYKQAYVWLKVLQLYSPDEKEISDDGLFRFKNQYDLDFKILDKVASITFDKIQDGEFTAPKS